MSLFSEEYYKNSQKEDLKELKELTQTPLTNEGISRSLDLCDTEYLQEKSNQGDFFSQLMLFFYFIKTEDQDKAGKYFDLAHEKDPYSTWKFIYENRLHSTLTDSMEISDGNKITLKTELDIAKLCYSYFKIEDEKNNNFFLNEKNRLESLYKYKSNDFHSKLELFESYNHVNDLCDDEQQEILSEINSDEERCDFLVFIYDEFDYLNPEVMSVLINSRDNIIEFILENIGDKELVYETLQRLEFSIIQNKYSSENRDDGDELEKLENIKLKISAEIKEKKYAKDLELKNKQLESEIHQKESLQNRMQKLVEQFTHSLGNVIFPDTIYQVAERWKNNPECRKDVLLLHEAYHSEIIIKLQGELLRQRYANTNPEQFRQFIRSCRLTPNAANNTKSIEDILDYAASRVTARFLNQHYAGLNSIREKMLSKKNVNLDALKQKFEDDILLNKSLRPVAWINQNLRPIQITEISPLWKKVFLRSESHAEALLFGYFSEILFNAFKYADHDKDAFLTLVFDEKTINDKTYLACSWQNPVKDNTPILGTGKGLDAIQEDLKQLNDTENPEESLLVYQQENKFQVTLFFQKDLLVNELPSLKIKRKANAE